MQACLLMILVLFGWSCGTSKKDDKKKISAKISAQGLQAVMETSLLSVEDESYGYPGIGMNYGESIVEGLKLKIFGIQLQQLKTDGSTGDAATLVDYGTDGKELQIAEGFSGKIEAEEDVEINDGVYQQVGVQVENGFSIKAYAYLDRDNDGTIDATVWTTATEVKMQAQKLAPGSMPDYDYYHYNWLVTTMAKNATDNAGLVVNNSTVLMTPLTVKDGVVTAANASGTESTGDALTIDLLIDTFRAIKVWDGRYGNYSSWTPGSGNPTQLPAPVFPFPQSSEDSRTLPSSGLGSNDFYPPGAPAFAFGNYLSIFALVNSSGLKAQNYLVSKAATITPYNAQTFTLVLDGSGSPLFAKLGIGEGDATLHIGPVARGFDKATDGSFTFGSAGAGTDADGNYDGGLMSSDDLAKAGHLFSNFRKLSLGQRAQMQMTDGPRCKQQYDYCVGAGGVTAYYLRAQ